MDIGYKPCPGLDKKHGFLINIKQKLTKSQEDLQQTVKIQGNKNQNNVRERRARPALQLYCIPAKRGPNEGRRNIFFEEDSDIRRPSEVEETPQKPQLKSHIGSNKLKIDKEPKHTDLREVIHSIRKSKAPANCLSEISPVRFPQSSVAIKPKPAHDDTAVTGSTSAVTDSISSYKIDNFHPVENEAKAKLLDKIQERPDDKESNKASKTTLTGVSLRGKHIIKPRPIQLKTKLAIKTEKLVDEGSKQSESDIINPLERVFENIVAEKLLLSRSSYKNGEIVDSGKPSTLPSTSTSFSPSDLAEQTLVKLLLRAKPQEWNANNDSSHKLTVGDSCLVADTIIDPCSVADESLNRAAMAIVTNSLNSEISSFRMGRVAMVIMQKEKGLTKSSPKMRFVHALLLACQRGASEPLPCHTPFISFVSLLYCCDIVRQSDGQPWAELLLHLFTTYLYSMTKVTEAEKLFSLLQKTGAHLERDSPAGVTELCRAVKVLFLSEKMDDKIKDILYDIIEGKAGAWKHVQP